MVIIKNSYKLPVTSMKREECITDFWLPLNQPFTVLNKAYLLVYITNITTGTVSGSPVVLLFFKSP